MIDEVDGIRYKRMPLFLAPIHTVTDLQATEAMDAAKHRRDFHRSYGSNRHWTDDHTVCF